jgi:hypothetical protein
MPAYKKNMRKCKLAFTVLLNVNFLREEVHSLFGSQEKKAEPLHIIYKYILRFEGSLFRVTSIQPLI